MKFKVGARIVVKDVRYGGNFDNGDVVTVDQIGCEDDPDCYGAISPYDGMMWYLYEDEVGPATNADRIRSMSDEELAEQLVIKIDGLEECSLYLSAPTGKMFIPRKEAVRVTLEWLRKPEEVD